ncbi:Molybdenum cofactor synthesis domain protein [Candidatus Sulfobium mesophilum]|uniref:Molybdopterin molybdenumtransferase n=1 Tax=Candidatus Sulfobium mesophilum TaxID=2016548 RepID=A0A2U3QHE7_9BACT|nr:Molybdenum cofactor synthesis domain protein [Candidatus Sulfobium mesophilum]
MRKGIYLENTPLAEALKLWADMIASEGIGPLGGESVPVADSLGRITAEAIFAKLSSPFYHSSAMDGYAVRFAETFGASESDPRRLRLGEETVYVDTGDPLPDGFNAVIMIEDINVIEGSQGQGHIEIIKPAAPWQHVRVIGEDIVSTELIVPENHRMRPVDIGAIISGGHLEVSVRRRPRVVIIPTGSEIVEPGTDLKKGDIIEYNSRILSALVIEWGGLPLRFKPVPDNIGKIKDAINEGCDRGDLIVINAGSSAGSEDFTAKVIAELGEVLLHGINIKPGKPVILGRVKGKPVLGIPGYPVSTYITFNLFAKDLVYKWQGLEGPDPEFMKARLSRQVASSLGQEEFLRVKLGRVGQNLIATPVSRGAGVLMSLVRADGIVRIPAMSEGFGAGTEVDVEMLRGKKDVENTVVCIGSHDNALDILANVLKKNHTAFSLSSAHVGSMGGLIALKKGEAHMAGTHLLDEETGEYNISYIKKILGHRKMLLINLVYRQQGLMVPKGNPKNIQGFGDLTRENVVFINRQTGAGTRLLTDKYLKELGIAPKDVRGYEREEYTHMGVASAVLTGIADTGMGILASAEALGLDFIPLAKERYDLAIPADFVEMPALSAILQIIRQSGEFRTSVEALGGYDISDMGKVMYES